MMNQDQIDEIVGDYVKAASSDYVGLWQIVIRVRHDFGLSDHTENRKIVMRIIKGMLSAGLEAVTLGPVGPGCTPWGNQNSNYVLDRISSEWDHLGHDPNPGDIVWFSSKPGSVERSEIGN
jgi:hypothetical protein